MQGHRGDGQSQTHPGAASKPFLGHDGDLGLGSTTRCILARLGWSRGQEGSDETQGTAVGAHLGGFTAPG